MGHPVDQLLDVLFKSTHLIRYKLKCPALRVEKTSICFAYFTSPPWQPMSVHKKISPIGPAYWPAIRNIYMHVLFYYIEDKCWKEKNLRFYQSCLSSKVISFHFISFHVIWFHFMFLITVLYIITILKFCGNPLNNKAPLLIYIYIH